MRSRTKRAKTAKVQSCQRIFPRRTFDWPAPTPGVLGNAQKRLFSIRRRAARAILPSRRPANFRDYEASLVGCCTGTELCAVGRHLRKRLSAIPSCAGLMTRLCCAHAQTAGIDVAAAAAASRPHVERHRGRERQAQRRFADQMRQLAGASPRRPSSRFPRRAGQWISGVPAFFITSPHLPQFWAMRCVGSPATPPCSTKASSSKPNLGDVLRVGFEYTGISRQSDRHQIEAWIPPSPVASGRSPGANCNLSRSRSSISVSRSPPRSTAFSAALSNSEPIRTR